MTEQAKKYLIDVLTAIDLVEVFTSQTVSFDTYEADRKTQSAAERQLVIIGEALNKLKKIEPGLTIENDKQIIAFRNRLVHGYDTIDNAIVWTIIQKYVPELRQEMNDLLQQNS